VSNRCHSPMVDPGRRCRRRRRGGCCQLRVEPICRKRCIVRLPSSLRIVGIGIVVVGVVVIIIIVVVSLSHVSPNLGQAKGPCAGTFRSSFSSRRRGGGRGRWGCSVLSPSEIGSSCCLSWRFRSRRWGLSESGNLSQPITRNWGSSSSSPLPPILHLTRYSCRPGCFPCSGPSSCVSSGSSIGHLLTKSCDSFFANFTHESVGILSSSWCGGSSLSRM
jgi:hypothetical protein